MTRQHVVASAIVAFVLAVPARTHAHRLDEYLQATRVSVDADRIRLEIDLSPGVDIADGIISAIDTDGDGRVRAAEADAYAASVLRALSVSVDDRRVPLQLESRVFPETGDMRQGVGTIHLTATTTVPATTGRHRLAFANAHRPGISVYLVNALVPSDPRIHLVAQHRDQLQRTFTLDYDVAGRHAWLGWSGAALVMAAFLVVGRRRSG